VSGASEISLFFGRLHPLLVHLPIGLLVLLGALELLARFPRFKGANANAGLILAFTIPAAIFSVICGLLLSEAGGYQDQLLQWHKWTAIATAAFCCLAGLLHSLHLKKLYRWCLSSSVLLLVLASHFGGSLTHGSDYLARYAPAPLRAWLGGEAPAPATPAKVQDPLQSPAFVGLVQPILKENCVSCHGPDKAKAGLRVDSLAAILKGGESGPALVGGKSSESLVLKRMRLPASDQDHMPPEGKPQPASSDLALIEWWIDAGASETKKIAELKPPPNIARLIEARFGIGPAVVKTVAPKPINEILPAAAKIADELSVAITALAPNEPWLQCNASVAGKDFGDAELAKLAPLSLNLRWLDLAGTKVSDLGLAALRNMPNLTRLHLERTAVTDGGLSNVVSLVGLEYLNLYATEIGDGGLQQLESLPKLKQVYLWRSKVTPAAATAFLENRTDKDQLQRWQEEIEQLKTKIRDAHLIVDLGTTVAASASTNAGPANSTCPVSGKPVDSAKTVLHEGVLIAFCCDDCKSKFQQDPKPFLEKLAQYLPKGSKPKDDPSKSGQ
jgi:uncharacterized membrane protein